MAKPGKPLTDEQQDEIIEAYAETESLTETEEEVEYSMKSVQKYVNQALEEGDPRLEHCEGWEEPTEDPGEWTTDGPTPSPTDPTEPEDVRNYAGMTPGEFIEDFFEDFEVGLKRNWVNMQARRADRRQVLPDKESIRADILNMRSGIGQSNYQDANYIAEEYWAAAQQYIRQTGVNVNGQPMANNAGMMGGGAGQQGWQPAGMGGVGGGPQGVGGQARGMNQQAEMFQMMMQQMRQMQEELAEIKSGGQDQSQQKSIIDQLEEFKHQKEMFEEMAGGDEYVQRLEQKIENLQTQIASSDDPGRMPATQEGESFQERMMMQAMQNPDVSMDDVMEMLESLDPSSKPVEVLELEKEKDLEEMKLSHEQERMEKVGDMLETAAERIGSGIGSSLVQGSGEEAEETEEEPQRRREPAQEREREPAMAEADGGTTARRQPSQGQQSQGGVQTQECPECGGTMVRGANSAMCQDCEYGIGPCDVCNSPLEIPPIGGAEAARCAECPAVIEFDPDEDEEVECPECEWEGSTEALRGELVQCDNCGEHRPIQRLEDLEQQNEAVEEFFDGD